VSNPPIRCLDCGKTWTGLRMEHCPACCQTFAGTRPGDMHRTGDHGISEGPKRRRCLTVAETLDRGIRADASGVLHFGRRAPESLPQRQQDGPTIAGLPEPTPQPDDASDSSFRGAL
jgi:hypothetical protein